MCPHVSQWVVVYRGAAPCPWRTAYIRAALMSPALFWTLGTQKKESPYRVHGLAGGGEQAAGSHVGSERPRGLMKYAELTNDGEWRRLPFVQGGVVKPVREPSRRGCAVPRPQGRGELKH